MPIVCALGSECCCCTPSCLSCCQGMGLMVWVGGCEYDPRVGALLLWRQAESWSCSAWTREGSEKTLEHL